MLSCRELVEETTADPELITPDHKLRWSVRLHLLMCRHCRRYVRQLHLLLGMVASERQQPGFADEKTVDHICAEINKRPADTPQEE